MKIHIATLALGAILVAACREAPGAAAAGNVVDSTLPRDVALARFREGLDSTDVLAGGTSSRDSLGILFAAAVESSDTAALRRLVMTKAEFAWLFYPTNPQALPPYDLDPPLYWFMLETRGRQGASHLFEERGGRPLGYLGMECDSVPSIEGENKVWGPCVVVRRQERGDTVRERLFGLILERRGRFKFVNYANKLD